MPKLNGIQWEPKKTDGSIEAWHTPETGKRNRAGKTYLGRLGKRRLAEWRSKPPEQFHELVCEWIAQKRAEKGIELLEPG